MGWQDRHYSRDHGSSSNPLIWLLSGSVPLFTAFGIRVRMHASLLLLIVIGLATSALPGGMGPAWAMTAAVALFVIILLHEFGHCFVGRAVGGEADEILMWPLGGLAYVNAPNRPWPQFATAAGGPLVNVVICLVTAGLTWALRHYSTIEFNPITKEFQVPAAWTISFYLFWIFEISWYLLLFNLLPIYPMDGGRLLQSLLWFKLGYYRSTLIACVVGMIGAALMVMYGITSFASWYGLMLIFIGISCFMYCYQLRAQLKAEGPWGFQEEGADYSAALWREESKKPRRPSRRALRGVRRRQQEEQAEQARIDAILAKVSAHGMHSLSWWERRALRKATERQRRREEQLTKMK